MSGAARVRSASARISLANLSPASNSQHSQKRVGRGRRSGYGKTSGRGHKGQKARSGGGPKPSFEGGQTPITKLFPKRGFFNQNNKEYAPVNLDRLQYWIDTGRLSSSPDKPITVRDLLLSGCIHDAHDGIKVLGDGAKYLKTPVHIEASKASKTAIRAIERIGGTVVCRYYNDLALRDVLKCRNDRLDAAPTRRKDIEWYTKYENRGYLSPKMLEKIPQANERWRKLSQELLSYKEQSLETD